MGIAKENQHGATKKVLVADLKAILVDQTKGSANCNVILGLALGIGDQQSCCQQDQSDKECRQKQNET